MSQGVATATAEPRPVQSVEIRPQPGPQEQSLACAADILFSGGGAGGGKTWSLLMEPLYHAAVPEFGATIFRRTIPEITKQGGMWDESWKLYPHVGSKPNENTLTWTFKSGASVQLAHLQHEKDKFNYKGAQIPLIGFDQVESFTEGQFWYLVSRNRSMCGVRPYIRATCNPTTADDPIGGWVHQLLAWWLDCDCAYCRALPKELSGCQTGVGTARTDRSGVVRYFARLANTIHWGATRAALAAAHPAEVCPERVGHDIDCLKIHALSFTFIPSRLTDNRKLMQADPGYYAKLKALPMVEQERLLGGNWKVRPEAGKVFNRAWFKLVDALPVGLHVLRYWDKAGTATEDNPAAAWTSGVKMGRDPATGRFYVCDVVRGQWNAGEREAVIKQTAQLDGPDVQQIVEQEPGSGGKESAENTVLNLAGSDVATDKVTGSKLARANPYAAQCYAGNVAVLIADWTEVYLDELHNFDPTKGGLKDQVDASSGAFNKLALVCSDMVFFSGGRVLGQQSAEEATANTVNEHGRTPFEEQVLQHGFYWPGGR